MEFKMALKVVQLIPFENINNTYAKFRLKIKPICKNSKKN